MAETSRRQVGSELDVVMSSVYRDVGLRAKLQKDNLRTMMSPAREEVSRRSLEVPQSPQRGRRDVGLRKVPKDKNYKKLM